MAKKEIRTGLRYVVEVETDDFRTVLAYLFNGDLPTGCVMVFDTQEDWHITPEECWGTHGNA